MIEKFKESFREESMELLNALESSLLELEDDPKNEEEIASVFRSMHTIKGSAAMFGFDHISEFAHEVETILDDVRNGAIEVTSPLISLTLEARDHIRALLAEDEDVSDELKSASAGLIERFRAEVEAQHAAGPKQPEPEEMVLDKPSSDSATEPPPGHHVTYRIRFAPNVDIYLNGTNPLLLLEELRDLGEYTAVPYLEKLTTLEEIDPEQCLIYWDVLLTTDRGIDAIRDVFIFVEDSAQISIDPIDDLDELDEGPYKRLGQILVERDVVEREVLERAINGQQRIGERLQAEGVSPEAVHAALEEQEHVQRARKRAQSELSSASIRVSSEKLDQLVDLVGELVTLQARLSQTVGGMQEQGLTAIVENFERLTDELRDSTMSVRMLPIGSTFSKFRRLVRDLSQELGKEIELAADGGETELDKTVIEKLNDPLVHIIRNSIDHGIESPEKRSAAGKPRAGTIRLSAEHSGASVMISVSDDGAGLNKDRIYRKAVDRGLIADGTVLSDADTYALIFQPGFSTAENVTQVSGRGVGMDVVRREIESLGGSVRVESEPGTGSTITLVIPLTLAIIDGLLVEIENESYVFPLGAVEECLELKASDVMDRTEDGKRMISNRGELLPFVRLRELFAIPGEQPEVEQIVVTDSGSGKIGYVVDNVVGDHQTVIKNLGRLYKELEGVSGATILGDGSVALIVDVQKLAGIVQRDQENRVA